MISSAPCAVRAVFVLNIKSMPGTHSCHTQTLLSGNSCLSHKCAQKNRGSRNRTHIDGFGDRCSTFELCPYLYQRHRADRLYYNTALTNYASPNFIFLQLFAASPLRQRPALRSHGRQGNSVSSYGYECPVLHIFHKFQTLNSGFCFEAILIF